MNITFLISSHILRAISRIAATRKDRAALACVGVEYSNAEGLQLIATDGRRLVACAVSPKLIGVADAFAFAIPCEVIQRVQWPRQVYVTFDTERNAGSIITSLTDALLEVRFDGSTYIQWRHVLPKEMPRRWPADWVALNAELLHGLLGLINQLPHKVGELRISQAQPDGPVYLTREGLIVAIMPMRLGDMLPASAMSQREAMAALKEAFPGERTWSSHYNVMQGQSNDVECALYLQPGITSVCDRASGSTWEEALANAKREWVPAPEASPEVPAVI